VSGDIVIVELGVSGGEDCDVAGDLGCVPHEVAVHLETEQTLDINNPNQMARKSRVETIPSKCMKCISLDSNRLNIVTRSLSSRWSNCS
jgi:hypothetical protein